MIMVDFDALKAFDFENADTYLWVFKESTTKAKFRTKFVQTEAELNKDLKGFVRAEVNRITEHSPYTYISQTNENSCLTIAFDSTDFKLLKSQVDLPEVEHRVKSVSDLVGAKGYVVKFIKDSVVVYAVKRSTSTWKTSYPKKFVNMVFKNGELKGVENNAFSIEKNFDFYVINDTAFIANKKGFESSMKHKEEYVQVFDTLQKNPGFSSLFSDVSSIVEYVGSNSIQLRRMAVIEEKGIYKQANFIKNLISVNSKRNWGLNFENDKIVPCEKTVKVILQVLLDHRLISEITDHIYDVPDAKQV
ncbi:DUF4868 domain-containing protein [Vibrio cholerae]|nr:DUF4868 domain-containing protein [Vibrio cholerae]RBM74026.1 DUF4868 domain-containing protein [Vibrio paracholerae]EGR0730480.1 DUF4868 domain-containing protein [Vibrio cholerae]EGR0786731.1 DUF4868 domain-containing protein [Vibrio cholerae]EGR0836792.1 DUF4868 domain-containing protein [Vibrio cholerae]